MPPYSNKKKKIQLQLKRQLKRERADDPKSFIRSIKQTQFRGKPVGGKNNLILHKQAGDGKFKDTGQRNRERFSDLQFFKDTDEEIKLRKEQAHLPIMPLEKMDLEIDASNSMAILDMPKRPAWNKSFSKEQLDRQEQVYFKNFVDKLIEDSASSGDRLSYFDLNLETWRQLWRVLEMSEIITIIVDIRHPLFHFPPSLYNYIVNDLNKMVIIVLNKIDLVAASLVIAWQSYLKSQYPEVHIIPFASYAGMKTKSNGKRVGNMKMAADGAKRFMLEVEKLVGPGKVDFTSWKEKIQSDSGLLDDENDKAVVEVNSSEDEGHVEEDADSIDDNANDDNDSYKTLDSEHENVGIKEATDEDSEEEEEFGSSALKKAPLIKVKNDTSYYIGEKYKNGLLTIGCVGHPNVGKSSFMNALIGKKVVSVSKTPGHTKHFQTIFLTPNIRLCDCPGLVFPSYYPKQLQVLMGCYPISQLREPYSSIRFLAERFDMVHKLKLKPIDEIRHQKAATIKDDKRYDIDEDTQKYNKAGTSAEWTAWSICESWAVEKGFFTAKAGRPDASRAANHLLRMALDGRTLCMSFYPPDYLSQKESIWEEHEEIEKIGRIQGRHNIANDDDDGY